MKKKSTGIFFITLLGVLLATYALFAMHSEKLRFKKRQECWNLLSKAVRVEVLHFNASAGIIIKDMRYGWMFSYNGEVKFPAASLIKIPILAASFKAAEEGKLSLRQEVTLQSKDKALGSGVLKEMPAGYKLSMEQIIATMITESDNTATNILIGSLGFEYLNGFFKEAGLTQTNLSRKMMDFKYRKYGVENYTSAADMAMLLEKFYRQDFLNPFVSKKCVWFLKQQKINDRIPARLPEGTIVAHKTGLERKVCHDVGIIYAPKGEVLICVLTRGAKSTKAAKEFIARLARQAYLCYQ